MTRNWQSAVRAVLGAEATREAAPVAAECIQHYPDTWRPVPGALEPVDRVAALTLEGEHAGEAKS